MFFFEETEKQDILDVIHNGDFLTELQNAYQGRELNPDEEYDRYQCQNPECSGYGDIIWYPKNDQERVVLT